MFQKFQFLLRGLKSFFLCSCYRLSKKLTYPIRIIPKHCFKEEIDIENLQREVQKLFVLRRSEKPLEDLFHLLGDIYILRSDALEDDDIPNMSMNLMGGKFEEKHAVYVPKMKTLGVEKWINKKRIYLDQFLNSYSVKRGITPIYFDVSKIHNIPVPYFRAKDSRATKLAEALLPLPNIVNNQYEFHSRGL